jgi:hypothetical protein
MSLYQYSKYKSWIEETLGRELGKDEYYSSHKITKLERIVNTDIELDYRFNQYGFRTNDWNDNQEECYVAFGCSNTLGVGIPEDSRWSNLLEDHTGKKVFNLGIGGGSADTVTRLAMGWLQEIKPTKVFVLWPPLHRWELAKQGKIKFFMPETANHILNKKPKKPEGNYMLNYLSEDFNSEINKRRNIYTMQDICYDLGIDLYTLEYLDYDYMDKGNARDGHHCGELFQKTVAEDFISLLGDSNE